MAELCGKPAKAGVRYFLLMSRFPVIHAMARVLSATKLTLIDVRFVETTEGFYE